MRLSGSVRAGLGIALCVLLTATWAAETDNGTKTNDASTVSPKTSNDSGVNVNITTASTLQTNASTTINVLTTNATTPNKTVTVTPTTPNITTAVPVSKTTPAATTKATEKPTSAKATTNATSTAAISTAPTTVGSTASAAIKNNRGFDLGSFIGGIVLTLSLLAVAYFGCRFYSSRRGVRYRTIDEHEAII